jgi:hypothetical protein
MTLPSIRCSELDRVLSCPGSLTLTRLVAPRQGDEGSEGTALHWLAHDRMLREMGAYGPADWKQPPMPPSVKFSHWIADFYFNHVRETVPEGWSLQVEAELGYKFSTATFDIETEATTETGFVLTGHIDAVAFSPDGTKAIAFDLKTGYDPVDPADANDQILGYCVLLLDGYPELQSIVFHIVQPRNDEDEGFQRVSTVTVEGDLLRGVRASLCARVESAIANNRQLVTGLKQCKWCPAAIQCPAQIQLRQQMKVLLTDEMIAKIRANPDDGLLAQWLIDARSLRRPMEDAEDIAEKRIEALGAITAPDGTHITIKEEGGSYSFPDPVGFYVATRKILPDDAAYAGTVKPSVAKTKDAIAKSMGIPKTSKKGNSADAVFDGALRPLCVQGVRKKKVFTAP